MAVEDYRIKTSWRRHWKRRKLKNLGGAEAVLAIEDLWAHCADERHNGSLAGMSNEEIVLNTEWPDDPDVLISYFVQCRLLEGKLGHYRIKDWNDHNPHVAGQGEVSERNRLAAKARWDKEAAKKATNAPGNASAMHVHADAYAGALHDENDAMPLPTNQPTILPTNYKHRANEAQSPAPEPPPVVSSSRSRKRPPDKTLGAPVALSEDRDVAVIDEPEQQPPPDLNIVQRSVLWRVIPGDHRALEYGAETRVDAPASSAQAAGDLVSQAGTVPQLTGPAIERELCARGWPVMGLQKLHEDLPIVGAGNIATFWRAVDVTAAAKGVGCRWGYLRSTYRNMREERTESPRQQKTVRQGVREPFETVHQTFESVRSSPEVGAVNGSRQFWKREPPPGRVTPQKDALQWLQRLSA